MNYHNITKEDMLNGEGLRVVLWVSGCDHRCEGCHNPETWERDSGIPFSESEKQEIFEELDKDFIDGITFSGGDPLETYNREEVSAFIREIRQKYGFTKTIWMYTGYLYSDVMDMDIFKEKLVDVVVEGEYLESKGCRKLQWVGSSNQNIVRLKR